MFLKPGNCPRTHLFLPCSFPLYQTGKAPEALLCAPLFLFPFFTSLFGLFVLLSLNLIQQVGHFKDRKGGIPPFIAALCACPVLRLLDCISRYYAEPYRY